MKIIFSIHAEDKFDLLKRYGWRITKTQIRDAIKQPKWKGESKFGQKTGMILVDESHILRVIFNKEGDIIKVITFHIARRGKYESTL